MKITEEIIDGKVYTVTELDSGGIIKELKMTDEQKALIAAAAAAYDALISAKTEAINTNLPTWQQVSDVIDNATTIAQLKVIIKKMARVLYWLAKNQEL